MKCIVYNCLSKGNFNVMKVVSADAELFIVVYLKVTNKPVKIILNTT